MSYLIEICYQYLQFINEPSKPELQVLEAVNTLGESSSQS